jgi:hypothetical protein
VDRYFGSWPIIGIYSMGVFLALIGINVVSLLVLILLRFLIGLVGFHYGLIRGSQ